MGFNLGSWYRRAPVTFVLVAAMIIVHIAVWIQTPLPWESLLQISGSYGMGSPLAWVLHILSPTSQLPWVLLFWVWLAMVGSSVESDLGSARYTRVLAILTLALPILPVVVGSLTLGTYFSGGYALMAALTLMWAARRPNATIMLLGIIPTPAWFIAVFVAAAAIVGAGGPHPIVGAALIPGFVAAWMWAADRTPIPYRVAVRTKAEQKAAKKAAAEHKAFLDDVMDRQKEREERERLRNLFEGSLRDDDNPK